MRLGRVLLTAIALCGALPVSSGAARNARSDFLDRLLPEFRWTGSWGFDYLCRQLKVPCGMEYRPEDSDPPWSGEWKSVEMKSVRQILDGMMRRHPGYRWGFEGDVLIIVPVGGEPSLLDRRVEAFTTGAEYSQNAFHRAASLGGISTFTRTVVGLTPIPRPRRIDVAVKRKSLRAVFCAIAAADGGMLWTYYPEWSDSTYHGPAYTTDEY